MSDFTTTTTTALRLILSSTQTSLYETRTLSREGNQHRFKQSCFKNKISSLFSPQLIGNRDHRCGARLRYLPPGPLARPSTRLRIRSAVEEACPSVHEIDIDLELFESGPDMVPALYR